MTITAEQVRRIAGSGARPELVDAIVKGWPDAEMKGGVSTRARAAGFLANICTETGGLRILSESGAYHAEQIKRIFGVGHHSAAVTDDEAEKIAALPVSQRGPVLFERVYGLGNPKKAKDLGNTHPGDGWKYRGGGMMQKTGGASYMAFQQKTGIAAYDHPELLRDPDTAFEAAWMEWGAGRCNADMDHEDLRAARREINGGYNGMAICENYYKRGMSVLTDEQFSTMYTPPLPRPAPHKDLPPVTETNDPSPVEQHPVPDPVPLPPEKPVVVSEQAESIDLSAKAKPVNLEDGKTHIDVKVVQAELASVGYAVGLPDGKWGGMTAGAVAAYMLDRGLKGEPHITDALKADLEQAVASGFMRPISEARASTTASQIPEAKQAGHLQIGGAIGAITAFITALVSSVGDHINSVKGTITPIQGYFTDAPGWTWEVLVAVVCVAIFVKSGAAKKAIVDSFQNGQRL